MVPTHKTPERLNVLYERNWTRLVHAQLRRFERAVVAGARADRDPQWGLPGSLLYALTLVTTVGWGSAAPRTAAGKAAGMIYALLGAPLLLLWLAAAGGLLARVARRAAARCRPHTTLSRHQLDNHFQLHEQHSLLGNSQHSSQYTSRESQCTSGTSQFTGPGQYSSQHIVHSAGARYSHVFQKVPASPRSGDTLMRGKQVSHNTSVDYLEECQQAATTSASGTPRRCCQQGTLCGNPRAPNTPSRTRSISHSHQSGDLNTIDDTLDTDESEAECMCSHDTPSRVPLIWRSQQAHTEHCKDEKLKSCVTTPGSTTSHQHHNVLQQTPPVPVAIVLVLLTAYLCLGATVFSVWEGWSFLDSIYFCFITISTIGFGDFAPGQSGSKLAANTSDSNKNEHVHLFACCAYLIFGLVLIAMSFSLVQEEVMAKCAQVANALGLVKH